MLAIIAAVSIAVAVGVSFALDGAASEWPTWKQNVPVWIGSPSALGVAAALYSLLVRRAWRWGIGRRRLSPVPDLRGTWFGTVTVEELAADGELTGFPVGEPQPCAVVIEQDLRKINVELHSPVSESRSEVAKLRWRGNEVTMTYLYKCERRPDVVGFGLHEGACTLKHRLAAKPEGLEARLKSLATRLRDPWSRRDYRPRLVGQYFTNGTADSPQHRGSLDVSWRTFELDRDLKSVVAHLPTSLVDRYKPTIDSFRRSLDAATPADQESR